VGCVKDRWKRNTVDTKQKILDIIRQKNTQLPTLPVIVNNILNIARDERTSAKDLAEFIERDQAITTKVLRLANSAYYGLMKEVDSISRAIAIIGFNEVIGMTIGMNVFSVFGKKDANNIFDMEKLWLHSIACATAARQIATRKRIGEVDKLFLVGLLHDIGKVIFSKYLPEEYACVFQQAKDSEVPLYRLEKEALGIDHAVLSGVLMKRWNFPDNLLLPSHFHHNSLSCPPFYQTFALIVELADYVTLKVKIGGSGNSVPPKVHDISRKLSLSSKEVLLIEDELRGQQSNIEEFLKLIS